MSYETNDIINIIDELIKDLSDTRAVCADNAKKVYFEMEKDERHSGYKEGHLVFACSILLIRRKTSELRN